MGYPQNKWTLIRDDWDSTGTKRLPRTDVYTNTSLNEASGDKIIDIAATTTVTIWTTSDTIQAFEFFYVKNLDSSNSVLVELTCGATLPVFTLGAGEFIRIPTDASYDGGLSGAATDYTTVKVKNAASSSVKVLFHVGR